MKRRSLGIILVVILLIAGCGKQNEEEPITIHARSETAGVSFTLDENWEFVENEAKDQSLNGAAAYDLIVQNKLTWSSIMILTEDLTQSEGKELIPEEAYVHQFRQGLTESEEYSYTCSEPEQETVCGEEYYTFLAQVEEPKAEQYYCIRRSENRMIVMIFTGYGEEKPDRLVDLGKPI